MFQTLRYCLLLAASLLLGACAQQQVNHDFDGQRDFAAYRSWAWQTPALEYRPDDPRIRSDLTEQRIRQAVAEQLDSKGLRPAAQGTRADLQVKSYLIVETRQQQVATTYPGFGPWGHYWAAPAYSEVRNLEYRVATLQIDLMDGRDGKLVWRGSTEQFFDESSPAPGQREAAVRASVAKVLSAYPPR